MTTRATHDKSGQESVTPYWLWRMTPIGRAVALTIAASGAVSIAPSAQAQQAFSPAWFAAKSSGQANVAANGALPNGQSANALTAPPRSSQAARELQQSITNLSAAAQALAMQQALQQQARQQALTAASGTPDGLSSGGLQVDKNPSTEGWTNANAPAETRSGSQTTVTIEQTADKAILNWQTFNVGAHTTVDFEQQPDWSVLNRVNDPAARPSQIEGQIKAAGSVYILNRNGILFSGTSQINTGSLIASSLDISNDKFKTDFITTTWDQSGPTFAADADAGAGDVGVAAGAQLTVGSGGRLMLLGGNVDNKGALAAPDGQVLFGASQQVYLSASNDPAVRGLVIALGQGGEASNEGLITTPRGNITLAGGDVTLGALAVNGHSTASVLTASTTLTANGSITLQAQDQSFVDKDDFGTFLGYTPGRSGNVDIGPGSVLQILPELTDTQTTTNDSVLAPSQIEVSGRNLHIERGALLQATGGTLTLNAMDIIPGTTAAYDDSLVQVDQGAVLDASGLRGVTLPMMQNFVQAELRGAELADDPALYAALYGQKVWVDIRDSGSFTDPLMQDVEWVADHPGTWQGSPLFNAAGYIGLIQHGIGELSTQGGTVTVNGYGDVILQQGSLLDVSGGTIHYSGGFVPVSYVVTAGGNYVPVGRATFGVPYIAVAGQYTESHPRWGVTETFDSPFVAKTYQWEDGYTDGEAAGTIDLIGHHIAASGDLRAVSTAGDRQTQLGQLPVGGTLILGANPTTATILNTGAAYNLVLGDTVIQQGAVTPVSGDHLPDDFVTTFSAAALEQGGIGQLQVHSNGSITVADDVNLNLGDHGSVLLHSVDIDMEGQIHAAGGSITLTSTSQPWATEPDSASFTLGAHSVLDVAGQWANAFTNPGTAPGVVDGGTVALLAGSATPTDDPHQYSLDIGTLHVDGHISVASGALIEVSGGGYVDSKRVLTLGNAGSITLAARDVDLQQGAQLKGYALGTPMQAGNGGSLTIVSQELLIGTSLGTLGSISGGVLPAGVAAPEDVQLSAPLVIPAGQPLPVDVTFSSMTVPPGVAVAAISTFYFSNTTSPLTLGAAWTVPTGISLVMTQGGPSYTAGTTIPAGTQVTYIYGTLQKGAMLPANVFPGGITNNYAISLIAPTGSALGTDTTLAAGMVIPEGTVMALDAAVEPPRLIASGLLGSGGFARYSLTGGRSLTLTPGTQIELAPASRVMVDPALYVSGTAIDDLGTLEVLPQGIRPVSSLALRAGLGTWVPDGDGAELASLTGTVSIGQGARIDAGAGGSLSLAAPENLLIAGTLLAPGGSIYASINVPSTGGGSTALTSAIWLTSGAQLLAPGVFVPSFNPWGQSTGTVLDGGSVTLDAAARGSLVTEAGSLIDVSGAMAQVDVPVVAVTASGDLALSRRTEVPQVQRQSIWSNAGSVTLTTHDGGYLDGDIRAQAPAPQAQGGSLTVMLNSTPIYFSGTTKATLEIGQDSAPRLPDTVVVDASTGTITGLTSTAMLYVSADAVHASGAGSLLLDSFDTIAFEGDVALSLSRNLALQAGVLRADVPAASVDNPNPTAHVQLSAAAVSVGVVDPVQMAQSSTAVASAGAGSLTINAGQILSLGGRTVLENIGNAKLVSAGDLRMDGGLTNQPQVDAFGNPIINQFGSQAYGYLPGGTFMAGGDLTLGGRQIYPGTDVPFTVATTGAAATLTVLPGDASAPAPLAVGGTLTLRAPNIVDQGVLRSPLGQIELDAGSSGTVTLTKGSVIDVSAHGQTLLYGTVINGDWYADYGSVTQSNIAPPVEAEIEIENPPAKRITLTGDVVDLQEGARIDLSGGGDLAAYQFVPGTGGSRNVLASTQAYAVLPGAQQAAAPQVAGSGIGVGSSVYLPAVPGLAAGDYTLLPVEYAALPGAFRVSVAQAQSDLPLGLDVVRSDGGWLVAGYKASSLDGTRDARTSSFLLLPSAGVHKYSELDEFTASSYFPQQAVAQNRVTPTLAADAGQLVLSANTALTLAGSFDLTAGVDAAGNRGRGGFADIASSSIAVVGDGAAPVAGYSLTIDASSLTAIGAQSLLLGGTRNNSADGLILTPVATSILVANNASSVLSAPEVLLVTRSAIDSGGGVQGSGTITVAQGAAIQATGSYSGTTTQPLLIGVAGTVPAGTGMGSLLVLTNASGDPAVQRTDIQGPGASITGTIAVDAGADLSADGSILLDATADTVVASNAALIASSLELASSAVSFGNAPAGTPGFTANAGSLAGLAQTQRLVLRSYGSMNFFDGGSFNVSDPSSGLSAVKELVLDAGALLQRSGGDITVSAQGLTVRNTSGSAGTAPATNSGTLTLSANTLTIDSGDSLIQGFSHAQLTAPQTVFSGTGSLRAQAADLTLNTARVITAAPSAAGTTSAGSSTAGGSTTAASSTSATTATVSTVSQALIADGALQVIAGGSAPSSGDDTDIGNGGTLSLTGNSVNLATTVRMPAGVLNVTALGDLTLASGAALDVSGRDQAFFDQSRTLPAGSITLTAQGGNVRVERGASLNLSDPNGGGQLTVTVPQGSFTIDGTATGGSFVLDAGTLPSFGAMQAALNAGGFAASRQVRLRSGDAVIDGTTQTRDFSLVVDQGGITVTGTIDASGATGGSISLSAANDVVLKSGSVLTVEGKDFDGSGKGGSVSLSAGNERIVNGQDLTNHAAVVDIQSGSLIDLGVANASAAARIISLNTAGSSVTVPASTTLGFPTGTPSGTRIEATVAVTITYADGTSASLAANTPASLPAGAALTLSAAGEVKVATGGGVQVALPLTGAFAAAGATTVSAVPVTLNAPGSTIDLAGGAPVILPNGTPGDDLITTTAKGVSITTVSNGSQVTLTAGKSSLQLSAGASVTPTQAMPAGTSLTLDSATVNSTSSTSTAISGTVVTLSNSGRSSFSLAESGGSGSASFANGLAAGVTLVQRLPGGASAIAPISITQPAGTAGNTVVVAGAGAGASTPTSGHLVFPSGTPAGVQLEFVSAGWTANVYNASNQLVNTVASATPFSVPAGGWVAGLSSTNAPASLPLKVVSGAAAFAVRVDATAAASAASVSYYGVTQISALTPGAVMTAGFASASALTPDFVYQGSAPVSVTVKAGVLTVSGGVTIANLPANVAVSLSTGGNLDLSGSGQAVTWTLGAGATYSGEQWALNTLSAGAVLTLEQAGQLSFGSGTSGVIPLILPAAAALSSTDTGLLALGGAQAGTLHLRAPQNAAGSDLGIAPIDGTVLGAAQIIAEGYRPYDLSGSNGQITDAVKQQVIADGTTFAANTPAIKARLLTNNPGLATVLTISPGVELDNSNSAAAGVLATQLASGGSLGVAANTTVTLPQGLAGGSLTGDGGSLLYNFAGGGATFGMTVNGTLAVLQAGIAVSFPQGSGAGGVLLSDGGGQAVLVLPDGTQSKVFNNAVVQPGGVLVMAMPGSYTFSAPTTVSVSVAGSYQLSTGSAAVSLPAGTTVTALEPGNLTFKTGSGSTSSLTVNVPNSGARSVDGVSFPAPQGGPAAVMLLTAGQSAIELQAGAALTFTQAGQVSANGGGTLYDASGNAVLTVAAGATVSVTAGETLKLTQPGATVTTLTASLMATVQGGSYALLGGTHVNEGLQLPYNGYANLTPGSQLTFALPAGTTSAAITLQGVGIQVLDATGALVSTTTANITTVAVGQGYQVLIPATVTNGAVENRQFTGGPLVVSLTNGMVAQSGGGTVDNTNVLVPAGTVAPASGDVVLASDWDLSSVRFGADKVPGVLTLRAAGDVVFQGASLSDGFAGGVTGTQLIDDASWSYRLVGGADFSAGSVLSVAPAFLLPTGKGSVIVNPSASGNVSVRTGTGSIEVAAGQDILLNDLITLTGVKYSDLYTAGRPAQVQPGGGSFTVLPDGRRAYNGGTFVLADDGGDITLTAQRDIYGNTRDQGFWYPAGSTTFADDFGPQNFSSWLLAQGDINTVTGLYSQQPAWGTAPGNLLEGVATIGGGNITVSAGRDLSEMNLAAANSGVYIGDSPSTATLQTLGGGDVRITTGRDLDGDQIYVAKGTGDIQVGGSVAAGVYRAWQQYSDIIEDSTPVYTFLSLGDAQLSVVARGNLNIGSIYDPTLTYSLVRSNAEAEYSYLSTYTERSAVSVESIAGNIWLGSQGSFGGAGGGYLDVPNGPRVYDIVTQQIYPGTVEAVAFGGNLAIGNANNGILMVPAHNGDLNLLASGNINFMMTGSDVGSALDYLVMSDADPSLLLTPTKNLQVLFNALFEPVPGFFPNWDLSLAHAQSLYRADDANPVRIYAGGDIVQAPYASNDDLPPMIVLPKPAQILAGEDILNLSLIGQNFTPAQTTVISAGRDFLESGLTAIGGWPDGNGIWIGGPGQLDVTAGRNLDLGKSNGIQTVGNQINPWLPQGHSANIVLTAGAGPSGPDYAAFASAYLDPASSSGDYNYATAMRDFVRQESGDSSLDAQAAWKLFQLLPEGVQESFERQIFYQELERVGTAGVPTGNYNAGYTAVAALFPKIGTSAATDGYTGALSLAYSQVRSLYDGSIDLLVPGGSIDGGVATVGPEIGNLTQTIGGGLSGSSTTTVNSLKDASQLGIVALRGGDVNIMAEGDVIVNQSRIFAIGGGDMVIWSSEGDINAGKGAKTAVLAPPPRLVFDPTTGGFSEELTGAATGSGIATLITEPDQPPGDMWLIAPHGTVDAGDAGIRVSGNFVLAAEHVRGLDNIDVKGTSLGLPDNTVHVDQLAAANAAAGAAVQTAQDLVQRQTVRKVRPTVIEVQILGFGEPTGDTGERGTSPRGERPPAATAYDPTGPVQLVGVGESYDPGLLSRLSAEQRRLLKEK